MKIQREHNNIQYVNKTFEIDTELYKQLTLRAKKEERTHSSLIRRAIKRYLTKKKSNRFDIISFFTKKNVKEEKD